MISRRNRVRTDYAVIVSPLHAQKLNVAAAAGRLIANVPRPVYREHFRDGARTAGRYLEPREVPRVIRLSIWAMDL